MTRHNFQLKQTDMMNYLYSILVIGFLAGCGRCGDGDGGGRSWRS